ncbi:hypothetical protein ABSL26_004347 [Yersinia enterocolitica]|uniref:hypothetical protein n=1 Tax=Yersinia enterocolitica TaxID=630 RepID=UPI0030C8EA9C|nr:hypothetical protein [Yersinia enterocolitica]HDL6944996.1 hypothetical protein [Yersinia enterocolitica]
MQNTGSVNSKESPPKFKVGDVFDTVYPFKKVNSYYGECSGEMEIIWIGGCHKNEEEDDDGTRYANYYIADAEGRRVLNVLGVVDMPGKWLRRILYTCDMINPDGKTKKGKEIHVVTESRFSDMCRGYFTEYEVEAK